MERARELQHVTALGLVASCSLRAPSALGAADPADGLPLPLGAVPPLALPGASCRCRMDPRYIVGTDEPGRPGRCRMFGGQSKQMIPIGFSLLPFCIHIVGTAVLLDPSNVTVLLKSVARLRRGRLNRGGKGVNPLADLLQVLRDWRRVSDAKPGASLSELGLKLSDGVLVMGAFFWCEWHSKLLSGV